jgi:hypothetical protein
MSGSAARRVAPAVRPFTCPVFAAPTSRYIIHAANAMSTDPVSVTDHSIASKPKKRLAPIPFSPCVFTPS